jgi:hypothetical protein
MKEMKLKERYHEARTWYSKVVVMEIYHLAKTSKDPRWTITKTAEYFNCSIGLTSENLRLAAALHDNSELVMIPSRNDALKLLSK